jgi:hypothetical protein
MDYSSPVALLDYCRTPCRHRQIASAKQRWELMGINRRRDHETNKEREGIHNSTLAWGCDASRTMLLLPSTEEEENHPPPSPPSSCRCCARWFSGHADCGQSKA